MKTRVLTGLFVAFSLAAIAGIAPDQGKIAQVESGALKEARLSWWGFNETDSTENIKAAIASKATTLIVDKMASPWITLPVSLKSDFTLVFEDGAEFLAKKGAYKRLGDCLVTVDMLSNVSIVGKGKGGILRMHKADYQGADYKHGEWRHGIIILSSNKVLVENMQVLESGGDGIYVGCNSRKSKQPYSKDVTIRKCVCDRNHRQGISVICAVNLLIEDTHMTNTSGTPPASGIDFEPNKADEPLVDCVMRNCLTENNQGAGYEFYVPQQNADKGGIGNVRIENCVSRNDRRFGLGFVSRLYSKGAVEERPFKFSLLAQNVTVENSWSSNYYFDVDLWQQADIRLEGCTSVDNRKRNKLGVPVSIAYTRAASDGKNASSIALKDFTVKDAMDMLPVSLADRAMVGCGKYNLSGNVTSVVNGKEKKYVYSKDTLATLFPDGDFDKLIPYDYRKAGLKPANADAHVSLPGAKIRHQGNFWVYLTEGKEATFKLTYAKLTNNTGKTAPVELVAPSGKSYPMGKIEFQATKQFTVKAPEGTGFYKVSFQNGNNWTILTESSVPAGIDVDCENGLNMIYMTGTYYFYVPENAQSGMICFWGDGAGEGAKITVKDPGGKVVFAGDNVVLKQLPVKGGKQPGIWSFTVAAPSRIALEDLTIKVMGIPPYITTSPEALPVIAK